MNIPQDWTFKDREVADHFNAHVREQLPWYDLVTGAVAHIARHYIPEKGTVLDLGCSTGNIGNHLRDTLDARGATFIPVDNSPDMLRNYAGPGTPVLADLSTWQIPPYDVAVAFLVLMFLPVESRGNVIRKLKTAMRPGGALIIVDKLENPGGYLGTVMARLALAGKVATGVPAPEIIAKELSLPGVQRPITLDELGSRTHEVFRFGEFAGWVLL